MSEKVYLNGEIMNMADASISVSNPGVLHGVGLFETLRSYEGRPFRLDQHMERLKNSAKKLRIAVDDVIDEVPTAIQKVLEANALKDARIRFTIMPPNAWDEASRSILLVAAQQLAGYPPELYAKGMTVFICTDYRQSSQDPLAGHKTTSYFPRLLALQTAQKRQCGEALWFTPDNLLAEGCISNVFIVKEEKLRTPPLNTPVLPGITRAVVLELAKENNIPAEETSCTIDDLLDADEVFLTNSIMEVMPVTRIERRLIADEKPGQVTNRLRQAYRALTTRET